MSQKQQNGSVITNGAAIDDKANNKISNKTNGSLSGIFAKNEGCWEPTNLNNFPTHTSTQPSSTLSRLNSLDCWDYTIELECLQGPQDLQLAAELGKTLLERNKELETALKQHQNIIEDQAQEIEYLQKQTGALREVNDSRLRIYEQLEIGIQDLERLNHRLTVENTAEKKHSKVLLHNIETLEARCEELTKSVEDLKQSLDIERRKNDRLVQEKNNRNDQYNAQLHNEDGLYNSSIRDEVDSEKVHTSHNTTTSSDYSNSGRGTYMKNANSTGTSESLAAVERLDVSNIPGEENEELIKLMTELEASKKAYISEQQRVSELEEQLMTIIQENQTLQTRVAQVSTNEEMKSVHEELSILEEVRQGTMCSRCLRSVDERNMLEEGSSIAATEDDDDRSYLELMSNPAESGNITYPPAVSLKNALKPDSLDLGTASPNPYRDLVEKYEALLEVQRHNIARRQSPPNLHEDLQTSGEFSSMNTKTTDDGYVGRGKSQPRSTISNGASSNAESNTNGITSANTETNKKSGKPSRRTPTDFSEAETSSSGFSDETSNKATQTDERRGFFLCSIGDGDDCKFSIYDDDASPIDSRFRNRPEYRELFKEIFAVLKKAAENKEEGDKLPLLDDTHPNVSKVPPVTPANEELPDFGDDTQSIISSVVSEQSVAMSECITKTERKTAVKKHFIEMGQENKPPLHGAAGTTAAIGTGKQPPIQENGRVLTPLKREPLEFLSVSVGVKKKNRKKNRNLNLDRSDSPILPSPPRVYMASGKKRRDMRPFNVAPLWSSPSSNTNTRSQSAALRNPPNEWNGNSMVIYNRNVQTTTPGSKVQNDCSGEVDMAQVEFRPSTVSQELHKLKKLDLSYAEVLRRADACKHHHRRK